MEVAGQSELFIDAADKSRGARTASRAWDVLMLNARRQAEGYARALPISATCRPPFSFADLGVHHRGLCGFLRIRGRSTRSSRDRAGAAGGIYEDLRIPRGALRLIAGCWADPMALKVTARGSARGDAKSPSGWRRSPRRSRATRNTRPKTWPCSSRCLFTMFAEDVELLRKGFISFQCLLRALRRRCLQIRTHRPSALGGNGQGWVCVCHRDPGQTVQRRVLQVARRAAAGPRGDR